MTSSDNLGDVTIENVISEVGFGKFQLLYFFFICTSVVFTIMASLSYIFTARDSTYRCLIPECDSDPNVYDEQWLPNAIPYQDDVPQKCERFSLRNVTASEVSTIDYKEKNTCDPTPFDNSTKIQCESLVYGEGQTIVKDFEIPCEKWKLSLVGTVGGLGQLVSLVISGILSDRYGRRNVMAIFTATVGVMGTIQSFSTSYVFFLVFEFLNMVAVRGANTTAFVLAIEMLTTKQRTIGCTIIQITDSSASVLLGLIAWATPSWRNQLRIISAPTLLLLMSIFIVPESFLWLHTKGKRAELESALKTAAKWNNKSVSQQSLLKLEQKSSKSHDSVQDIKKENVTLFTMFKSRRLSIRIVACSLCWFGNIMLYYGLSLNSINIGYGKNIYLNFIYVSSMEFISIFIYAIILKYLPRKWSAFIGLIVTGMLCIVYAVVPSYGILPLCMYFLAKIFMSTSYKLIYVYMAEMFPTCLRNSSMCLCSLFAKIAGALAPQFLLLATYYQGLPMIVFGIVAGLSALPVLLMPETRGKDLPDTIQQAKDL